MTRSDQLRQALDGSEYGHDDEGVPYIKGPLCFAFREAARCWLRLQEADEKTVEKMAKAIHEWDDESGLSWEGLLEVNSSSLVYYRNVARAVLAAIVGEET